MRTISDRCYTVTASTDGERVSADRLTADEARQLATVLRFDPASVVTVTCTCRRIAAQALRIAAAWLILFITFMAVVEPEVLIAVATWVFGGEW
ncbi:MAG: hypothetical protein ACRDQH_13665 [Pseudonocardiaceae bacterium]